MNKFLSISLLVMLIFTSGALLATRENASTLPRDSSTGNAAIGGAFTLTDQNKKQVSDTDFRGKHMLVFFGFTRCPMICPTSMATLTSTLDQLGDKANNIAPIFITVDPANDTPDVMKEYLSGFSPRIIGLTGSDAQIKEVADLYKAYFAPSEGTMDHSTFIYLLNEKGEYVTHYPYDIAADELAKKLAEQLKS